MASFERKDNEPLNAIDLGQGRVENAQRANQNAYTPIPTNNGMVNQNAYTPIPTNNGKVNQNAYTPIPTNKGKVIQNAYTPIPTNNCKVNQKAYTPIPTNNGKVNQNAYTPIPANKGNMKCYFNLVSMKEFSRIRVVNVWGGASVILKMSFMILITEICLLEVL